MERYGSVARGFYPVCAPISDWDGRGVDLTSHINQNMSVFAVRMLKR